MRAATTESAASDQVEQSTGRRSGRSSQQPAAKVDPPPGAGRLLIGLDSRPVAQPAQEVEDTCPIAQLLDETKYEKQQAMIKPSSSS